MDDNAAWLSLGLHALVGAAIGLLISLAISLSYRLLRRKSEVLNLLSRRMRTPHRVFFTYVGLFVGVSIHHLHSPLAETVSWYPPMLHALLILLFFAIAFLLTGLVRSIEDIIIRHNQITDGDRDKELKVETRLQIISRIIITAVWLGAIAGALMTFESFRTLGASMFASAGVASLVAGLAARSLLSNVFAGLQIAMSEAIKVHDVVKLDGERAQVEEITLTYVVLRIWDGRRLIVPSTRFTARSFENWSRQSTEIIGTVFLDVDWTVPIEQLRAAALQLIHDNELWDGRKAAVLVTDATGGQVQVRASMSAANPDDSWQLRCQVREGIVSWLQQNAPAALPLTRVSLRSPESVSDAP